MLKQLRPAIALFIVLTLITGVLYPLAITATAKVFFPHQATGSVITVDGHAVGSSLLGQPFSEAKYFWPRPSSTSPVPYAGEAGAGSNLAPSNPALIERVKQRVREFREADPGNAQPIPLDLVTASASGLDPHISVAGARYQVARVAKARGMSESQLSSLVDEMTEPRTFGILGEPRVNVVLLNLALDHPAPATKPVENSPVLTRWPMTVR